MGCGSSRDAEVQTHYRDSSEPETSVSTLPDGRGSSRLEPEGQESEDPKHDPNDQQGPAAYQRRVKPQRELWAHPPPASPKRPCPKPKSARSRPKPTDKPGHTFKDLRKRRERESEDNFLMLYEQENG